MASTSPASGSAPPRRNPRTLAISRPGRAIPICCA
jgi:hypothetical protein